MSFINSYKPPAPVDPTYGPDPYDVNFVFPIHPSTLENNRVKLTPFIPSRHAQSYWDQSQDHPELQRHTMWAFPTLDDFLNCMETMIRLNPTCCMFSIIDKTKTSKDASYLADEGGSFAGIIGLIYCSASNLTTEIGGITVLPAFQHTHVSTNAVDLLMQYCFSAPSAPSKPGLGLRRVQWTTHPDNVPSRKVAERMGMKKEGYMRWTWVLPEGKEGGKTRKEGEGSGRDSLLFAVCWDDWEGGIRESVEKLMEST